MNVKKAILALVDGTVFEGRALGYEGETCGEVVFNTAMTGYQEVLTDPSYYGQIVVMTARLDEPAVLREGPRRPQRGGLRPRDVDLRSIVRVRLGSQRRRSCDVDIEDAILLHGAEDFLSERGEPVRRGHSGREGEPVTLGDPARRGPVRGDGFAGRARLRLRKTTRQAN